MIPMFNSFIYQCSDVIVVYREPLEPDAGAVQLLIIPKLHNSSRVLRVQRKSNITLRRTRLTDFPNFALDKFRYYN